MPEEARAEFFKPKRPAILRRPIYQPPSSDRFGILKWVGAFALVALVLAGVFGHYSASLKQPATLQHATPVVQPTPVPVVQPTPAQPASQLPAPPPPAVAAPRARLVLYKKWRGNSVWEVMDSTGNTVKILIDPAPRAQLVCLPEWQPGTELAMRMPYDSSYEVRGVLRGYLADVEQLPRSGNRIGDTYVVNGCRVFG